MKGRMKPAMAPAAAAPAAAHPPQPPARDLSAVHGPTLSDAELELFWDQGYLVLGRAAPLESIEHLCRRADQILLGDVQYPGMTFQLCPSAVDQAEQWKAAHEDGGVQAAVAAARTLKYRKVQGWERDASFLEYMQLPLFRDVTRKIIESDSVSIFRSMFFNKPAAEPGVSEGGVVINWHQDGNTNGGWNLSIDPRLTVWTALDKTTVDNGCVSSSQHDGCGCCCCCCRRRYLRLLLFTRFQRCCCSYKSSPAPTASPSTPRVISSARRSGSSTPRKIAS